MHEAIMREVIAMAVASVQGCGGPFGAVVVQDGRIIGRGTNEVTASNDPTAHAEVLAIRRACLAVQSFRLTGCDIYASCEPCPMCLAAIYWARIDRVYFAATRADAAAAGFDDADIYQELALPVAERHVPMTQLALAEALAPMEAWQGSPNKVPY
jgi:tRNA(Arg) A34 adenosine deaminase TadA